MDNWTCVNNGNLWMHCLLYYHPFGWFQVECCSAALAQIVERWSEEPEAAGAVPVGGLSADCIDRMRRYLNTYTAGD